MVPALLLLTLLACGKQHYVNPTARRLLAAPTGLTRRISAKGESLVVWAVPALLLLRQQTQRNSAETGPLSQATQLWVWVPTSGGRQLSAACRGSLFG